MYYIAAIIFLSFFPLQSSSYNNLSSSSSSYSTSSSTAQSKRSKHNQNKISVPIEYWHQTHSKWTDKAQLTLNIKAKKVLIEIGEQSQVAFQLDQTLRIEHAQPLSRDFNAILVGTAGKHRIAFFGEDEGNEFLRSLQGFGAQIIRRRSLPPCLFSRVASKSKLRPISEGEALINARKESESEDQDNMRLEDSENSVRILRRKSTGSDSEMKNKDNYLPRSISMSIKEKKLNQKYENEINDGRGLSTENTVIRKKKANSDQSLDSDCMSSESTPSQANTELDFEFTTSSSEDEICDHIQANMEIKDNNEKLEKYKFMLVNLEEDEDMLDPSQFGAIGDMVQCQFQDYPDDLDPDCVDNVQHKGNLDQGPNWIRKSFEDLDLDVTRTSRQSSSSSRIMASTAADLISFKKRNSTLTRSHSIRKKQTVNFRLCYL